MGSSHYCDICKNDLPTNANEIYILELYPQIGIRDINSGQVGLNMEICKDCAINIHNEVIGREERCQNGRC